MPFKPKNSRFYHYDFQVGGCRFHGSCGTESYQEAKAVEAQARVEAKRGATRKSSYTVAEALGSYWSDVCQHQASASTAKSQARMILQFIKPATPIEKLTTNAIFQAVAKMRAAVSNATANRRIDMLARSIRHMAKVHNAAVPNIDWKVAKSREPEERIRTLSRDEEARLFEALRPDLRPMVRFAIQSGRRRAEICELRWSDVDLENNRIWFTVKGGKRQSTHLTSGFKAMLLSLPRSRVVRERPFVFTWEAEDGERYRINPSGGHIWAVWRSAVRAAEIDDLRFHDLRHTFATRMLRATGNIKLVSKLLGHSSIETTSRYAHVLDEDMAEAMERFTAASPEEIPEVERKSQ